MTPAWFAVPVGTEACGVLSTWLIPPLAKSLQAYPVTALEILQKPS